VAGRGAKLYLNGSAQPSLVVDGLKGEDLHGAVGLWSFTGEESYFSNVRIIPAVPQNLKNGSDVAGSWDMRYASDAGGMELSLPCEWRKDGGRGAPGPVNAFLTGWIDGNSGKGRMRVEGRSDGVWVASRRE
jgi:hypothetical protein